MAALGLAVAVPAGEPEPAEESSKRKKGVEEDDDNDSKKKKLKAAAAVAEKRVGCAKPSKKCARQCRGCQL
eukprot:2773249-Heterocapsa_arctica.AAC.1